MTDRDNRIEAALAALDKVTPGPWSVIYGAGDDYSEVIANPRRLFVADVETKDDATLIAAAPDLAAEVIRLRKWQSEAVLKLRGYHAVRRRCFCDYCKDEMKTLNRLIAEAEGE